MFHFLGVFSELASWPALTKIYQSVAMFHCILDKNPQDLMCPLLLAWDPRSDDFSQSQIWRKQNKTELTEFYGRRKKRDDVPLSEQLTLDYVPMML